METFFFLASLWGTTKVVLRRKRITFSTYIRKKQTKSVPKVLLYEGEGNKDKINPEYIEKRKPWKRRIWDRA